MTTSVVEEIRNLIESVPNKKVEVDNRLTSEDVKDQIELHLKQRDWSKKTVSYSSWALYERCPSSWYHTYVTKTIKYIPSIHTVFGTAFHEMFQQYFEVMTSKSVKAADSLDVGKILVTNMKAEYLKSMKNRTEDFCTPQELGEFWQDGVAIMKWFKARRRLYFNSRDTVLLGIELPIFTPVLGNVHVIGYLDLVIFNKRTRKVTIIDIKTSGRGWNKWTKADKLKQSQLVLYKIYMSEQYDIPLDDITIQFFIVKRKLQEDSDFPQKRVQVFEPSSGKVTINRVKKAFNLFLEKCYKPDGTIISEQEFPAIEGERQKNCTFCALKDNFELCPKSARLKSKPS